MFYQIHQQHSIKRQLISLTSSSKTCIYTDIQKEEVADSPKATTAKTPVNKN